MNKTQTAEAVTLIKLADKLRTERLLAEQSFATLHLVDGFLREQHAAENALVRLMRPTYESLSMADGLSLSNQLHDLAGV